MKLITRAGVLTFGALIAAPAGAQVLQDVLPVSALNCALTAPPDKAGIAATPGGFVMVYPRNDVLTDSFTGCKIMWIVDGAAPRRFATLYFRDGKLAVAAAHDTRGDAGALSGACAFPEGKSLLRTNGDQTADGGCAGIADDSFYQLRLATWPRTCLTNANAAICQADPRE